MADRQNSETVSSLVILRQPAILLQMVSCRDNVKSFRQWLAGYCVALEQGTYTVDEEGFIEPADG